MKYIDQNKISQFLQYKLLKQQIEFTTAVEAATWLDREGLLKDSKDRPGKNLRRLLRESNVIILGQEQLSNKRWIVREILMVASRQQIYRNNGLFNVHRGQNITETVRDANVPNGYGIYFIFENHACSGELIYIGRAGTIQSDGSMKEQGIRKRLGMKQDGKSRNVYYKKYMEDIQMGISVAWFVTFDEWTKILPSFAEVEAIQDYYSSAGKLPKLNKSF